MNLQGYTPKQHFISNPHQKKVASKLGGVVNIYWKIDALALSKINLRIINRKHCSYIAASQKKGGFDIRSMTKKFFQVDPINILFRCS